MKILPVVFVAFGLFGAENGIPPQETKNPVPPVGFSSDYLGQTRPGDTPIVFARGVISTGDLHGRLVISPDGKEMFWTSFSQASGQFVVRIMHVAYRNGQWTLPQPPSFASPGMTANPLFSPDGKRLYFGRKEGDSDWATQFVERTDTGWGQPKNGGFLLNLSCSFTHSGMVYFTDSMKGKPWNQGIYRAQYSPGGYSNRQALDPVINSPSIDYTPYISPDETYLMFSSSRPSADENMFLTISFRNADGTWTPPQRMNEKMNFPGKARFPSISPDGKYLFFCGDDGNIYWVDIKVIEKFRPASSPNE